MDPVSVLSIAASAASAAQGAVDIVVFFRDARNLHKTGEAFAEEIGALGAACDMVHVRLQQVVKDYEVDAQANKSPIAGRGQLWDYLKTQITACRKTILQFRDAVVDTQGVTKDTNFFEKAFRQSKLSMKAANITEARDRIRSHTTALQSVLLCVSIEISHLAPQRADQTLQTQLTELIEQNKELSSLLSKHWSDEQKYQANEAAILQMSDQIISSGKSLYAESIAGGSVFGELDPSKHESINSWLHDADIIDSQSSGTSNTEQDGRYIYSSVNSLGADTQTTSSSHPPSPALHSSDKSNVGPNGLQYDSDLEDDFLVDIAKHSIATGRHAFESGDFSEAQPTLEEALKLTLELPIKQRQICNTSEIRYMLSVCAFHQEKPLVAKTALLGVIESKADTMQTDRSHQICEVGHLLAQTCVRLGELEQARMHCESALSGRRRLLGQAHRDTWESWALRARIWELSGNLRRAKLMFDMVPKSEEAGLIGKFDSLVVEKSTKVTVPSTLPKEASHTSQEFSGDASPFQNLNKTNQSAPTAVPTSHGVPLLVHTPDIAPDEQRYRAKKPSDPTASTIPQDRPGISQPHGTQCFDRDRRSSEQLSPEATPLTTAEAFPELASAAQYKYTPSSPLPEESGKSQTTFNGIPLPWHHSSDENQTYPLRPEPSHELVVEATKRREERERLLAWCPLTPSSDLALALAHSDDDEAFRLVPQKQTPQASAKKSNFWKHLRRTSGDTGPVAAEGPGMWMSENGFSFDETRGIRKSLPFIILWLEEGNVRRFISRVTANARTAPTTDLLLAALCGLPKVTLALLGSGTTVTNSSSEGAEDQWTPLCYAALGGSVQVAHQFMAAGYLINASNTVLPLCLAVTMGRTKFAAFLLERGADPLAPVLQYGSALHSACATDNLELVKTLSGSEHAYTTQSRILLPPLVPWLAPPTRVVNERKDEMNCLDTTAIGIAAYTNSFNVVEYLLAQGVDASSVTTINGHFIRVKAISLAAINGADAVIRALLKHGVSASGDALRYASLNGNTSTAQVLIEAGTKASSFPTPHPTPPVDYETEEQSTSRAPAPAPAPAPVSVPEPEPEPEAEPRSKPAKRPIQERSLAVTLEEVFHGTTKKLRVRRKVYDSATGAQTEEAKILSVPIKRGLQVGSKIKYDECGDQLTPDGPFADLHFVLQYKEHAVFRREGNDIVSVLKLREEEAKMVRSVATIDGEDVKVGFYGFLHDRVKRFPGLGMPVSRTPELRGDFVVHLEVDGW